MPIAAAIQGTAGIASSAMSAAASKKIARMQIAWEKQKAQNAHQWEVEDLKAAGLNPILSADNSGAQAGSINPPMPDFNGMRDVGQALATSAEIAKTKQETKNAEETAQNIAADTELKQAQKEETTANTAVKMAEEGLIKRKTATELIEQTKKQGEVNKLRAETNKIYTTLNLEIKQLEQQIEVLKSQRRYNEANALNKELQNKYYVLNLVGDKAEQASRIIENSASGAFNIVKTLTEIPNIIPIKKAIGFMTDYVTK